MKKLILSVLVVMSAAAFAAEPPPVDPSVDPSAPIVCPTTAENIATMISLASSCYEASSIANQCAYGSSADLQIVAAAKDICVKEAGPLSKADQSLLTRMSKRCVQAYKGQQGTMYMSMMAFCELKAVEFINSVQSKVL